MEGPNPQEDEATIEEEESSHHLRAHVALSSASFS